MAIFGMVFDTFDDCANSLSWEAYPKNCQSSYEQGEDQDSLLGKSMRT